MLVCIYRVCECTSLTPLLAPEVLNASGYGKEVDMWSIGVITYILLCGFPPFYGDTVPEIFEQIMEANFDYPEEYWGSVSKEGMRGCAPTLCLCGC